MQEDPKNHETPKKKVDESWKEKAREQDTLDAEAAEDRFLHEPTLAFFLTSLGMQAYVALGLVANPATNKIEKNLEQAKYIIDTLGMLEVKTQGNRDKDESEILDHLLYELRLAYVRENAPEAPAA
ncbi:MAG: DUF1844 domain-containing protein [Deltaproteobacteria bacterium]